MRFYDALDALGQIIEKSNCPFSKKDVEHILNVMGERSERSRMKKLWDQRGGQRVQGN